MLGRFLVSTPVAAVITFELFVFMHGLIADKAAAINEDVRHERIVLYQTVSDIEPVRDRDMTPADIGDVTEPPPAPRIAVAQTGAPSEASVAIIGRMPELSIKDIQIAREDINFRVSDRDAQPIVRIPPMYPPRAAERSLEGDCLMVFDVGPDGTPINIRAQACSNDTFRDASVRAVEQWRYSPKIIDGQTVARTGVETRITYVLTD